MGTWGTTRNFWQLLSLMLLSWCQGMKKNGGNNTSCDVERGKEGRCGKQCKLHCRRKTKGKVKVIGRRKQWGINLGGEGQWMCTHKVKWGWEKRGPSTEDSILANSSRGLECRQKMVRKICFLLEIPRPHAFHTLPQSSLLTFVCIQECLRNLWTRNFTPFFCFIFSQQFIAQPQYLSVSVLKVQHFCKPISFCTSFWVPRN